MQLKGYDIYSYSTFLWQAGMSSSGRYGRLACLFRNVKAFISISWKKNPNCQILTLFPLPSGRLVLLQGSQVPHNTVEFERGGGES